MWINCRVSTSKKGVTNNIQPQMCHKLLLNSGRILSQNCDSFPFFNFREHWHAYMVFIMYPWDFYNHSDTSEACFTHVIHLRLGQKYGLASHRFSCDVRSDLMLVVIMAIRLQIIILDVALLQTRYNDVCLAVTYPDSKVHGANMGHTCVLSAPGGPRVGPTDEPCSQSISSK